jgi:hypothetical protein
MDLRLAIKPTPQLSFSSFALYKVFASSTVAPRNLRIFSVLYGAIPGRSKRSFCNFNDARFLLDKREPAWEVIGRDVGLAGFCLALPELRRACFATFVVREEEDIIFNSLCGTVFDDPRCALWE